MFGEGYLGFSHLETKPKGDFLEKDVFEGIPPLDRLEEMAEEREDYFDSSEDELRVIYDYSEVLGNEEGLLEHGYDSSDMDRTETRRLYVSPKGYKQDLLWFQEDFQQEGKWHFIVWDGDQHFVRYPSGCDRSEHPACFAFRGLRQYEDGHISEVTFFRYRGNIVEYSIMGFYPGKIVFDVDEGRFLDIDLCRDDNFRTARFLLSFFGLSEAEMVDLKKEDLKLNF